MHGSHEAGWHGDDTVLDIYLHLPTPDAGVVKVRQPLHLLSLFRGQRPTAANHNDRNTTEHRQVIVELCPQTCKVKNHLGDYAIGSYVRTVDHKPDMHSK